MIVHKNLEPKKFVDCLTCKYHNKFLKKCEGKGIECFEYDTLINTLIDPITKLPIKKIKEES